VFNVGPMELLVLAFVGLVLVGPDRLPGYAKDAARMLRTLREMANGAKTQLREELGPEFADIDLRSLNPRTAISRALLGDDIDPASLNPRTAMQRTFHDLSSPSPSPSSGGGGGGGGETVSPPPTSQRPLGRGEAAPFDSDAT
jgi:sec-independent protein translocase protein TatB